MAHKYGHTIGLDTIHVLLQSCLENRDWDTAVWSLSLMRQEGCEPNSQTYDLILNLAITSHSPHALAAGIFYGAIDFKLRYSIRARLKEIFTFQDHDRFWNNHRPRIFNGKMAMTMKESTIFSPKAAVARAIRIIHDSTVGLVPPPLDVTLESAVRRDRKMKEGEEAGPLKIKMRSKTDPDSPVKVFRLGYRFDPFTMIDNFEVRPQRTERRTKWSKAPAPKETPPAKPLPGKAVEEAPSKDLPSTASAENDALPGIRKNRFGTLKEALDGIISEAAEADASLRPAQTVAGKEVKGQSSKVAIPGQASVKHSSKSSDGAYSGRIQAARRKG